MARIPYFDMTEAPEEYKALLAGRPPLNLYRMLPHAGAAYSQGFLALGGAILRGNDLDPKLREIAILRVGLLGKAGYEVHQHTRVARKAGLSDAKIAALEVGADTAALDDTEKLVLEFTDKVFHDLKAPDELFDRVSARFGHRQTAQLVLVIGFYMLVSRFLENFEVDIEPPGAVV